VSRDHVTGGGEPPYELAVEGSPNRRLAVAFGELALAI
jgi:hypothetical protein